MRLPFFYGWLIVAVTFVTMAIGVNARTAFSLFSVSYTHLTLPTKRIV